MTVVQQVGHLYSLCLCCLFLSSNVVWPRVSRIIQAASPAVLNRVSKFSRGAACPLLSGPTEFTYYQMIVGGMPMRARNFLRLLRPALFLTLVLV